MHSHMQYLNSRRGVYSGLCVLVALFGLILLSGTMGFSNNMSNGRVSPELAHQVGASSWASFNGHPVYEAWALHENAGFFINLTFGMMEVLAWGMLVGLLGLALIGVMQRSFAMTVVPGIVFIVAVTMIGQEWFQVYNYSWFTENPVAVAAIITGAGAVALAVLNRWKPAMIPRTPDAPPADVRSERSPVAVDHRP